MITFIKSIILCLAFAAIAANANAQYLWHIEHSDQIGEIEYLFHSVSCFGNNCTVGTTTIDLSTYQTKVIMSESTDGGKTWIQQTPQISHPFTFRNYGFMKIQRIDSLNIVGISDSGFVARSFDGGATWERQSCPTPYLLKDVDFSDPMTGIIVGGGDPYQIFLTSDGGRHWDPAPLGGIAGFVGCHSYGNGKFRVFKYQSGRIYTTLDNFKTVTVTEPIFDSLTPRSYAYVPAACTFSNGDTILAYGKYYQKDTIDLFNGYGLIVRSIDGGQHWEKAYTFETIYFDQISHTTQLDRDTVLAIGSAVPNVLLSTDRGYSWRIDSLVMDTSYYTIGSNGIAMAGDGHPIALLTSLPTLNDQSIILRGELKKASVYDLIAYKTHVYPNPTTGSVTISSIDVSRPVFIYDLLGREVLKGTLSASGNITFDLTSFPPGLYTIILNHNGKMIPVGKIVHQK